jgi:hypothetical protein
VTRVTALRTGEVDFANVVPREQVERLSREAKIQLLKGRDTLRINSYFNQGKARFKDVRVRRALLGYGVDRPIFCDAGSGTATGIKSWGCRGRRSIPISCRGSSIPGRETIPSTTTTSK